MSFKILVTTTFRCGGANSGASVNVTELTFDDYRDAKAAYVRINEHYRESGDIKQDAIALNFMP